MARILTQDTTDDVTETIAYDEGSDTVVVRHSQDVEPVIEQVAAANLAGVRDVEGLGRPAFEVPVTVAMEFCLKRGIPWEKFLYSNEYDSEWVRFGQEYSRLAYKAQRKTFAVSG
jgi:hypothetical protein